MRPPGARWASRRTRLGIPDAGRQVLECRARLAGGQVKGPEPGRYCGPARSWLQWRGAGFGTPREGKSRDVWTPLGTCPEPAVRAGLPCPWNFSVSVELAYLSCLLLRVLFDAAGGIPCTASRFPSALQGESVGRSRPQSASTSSL